MDPSAAHPPRSESVVVFRAAPMLPDEARAQRRAALLQYLRTHDAVCPNCRYNLRGLQGVQCPECSWVFDLTLLQQNQAAAVTPRRLPWTIRWITVGLAGAHTVVLLVLAVAGGSFGLAVGAAFAAAGFGLGTRWFGPRARTTTSWRTNLARLAIVWGLLAAASLHRLIFV